MHKPPTPREAAETQAPKTAIAAVLKTHVQLILKRMGLYNRLKASPLYGVYWRVANRSLVDDRGKEVAFYRNLLKGLHPGGLIFDVGANQGTKTDVFLRLGARVVAVEPDETNQHILIERYLRFRLTRTPVVIVGKAVSDKSAVETMWIDEPGSAKNTLSGKWVETLRNDGTRFGQRLTFALRKEIPTTTLDQLVTKYGLPFFIKIDVEGYELSVLRGLRRPVPYLSFEVNLPEFRPEGLQCVEVLGRLAAEGRFNYAADCRQGLAREDWLGPQEFSRVLSQCEDKSIEVFWKTSP
jgi:FkbM family methyltransferase